VAIAERLWTQFYKEAAERAATEYNNSRRVRRLFHHRPVGNALFTVPERSAARLPTECGVAFLVALMENGAGRMATIHPDQTT